MRCLKPIEVGREPDGNTIAFSRKKRDPQFATFKVPCNRCIECRLEYARQWAVRCVHEAEMYGDNNVFITLTYDQEHHTDEKLDYRDFQLFMKRLRKLQDEPIGFFATGEYGDKGKRKHWHAIIFNWKPLDPEYYATNKLGDVTYTSEVLTRIWGKGFANFGSVTFKSAGYCARYAAKKLVHGHDDDHRFHPISKKSNKHAIGKKWLEKNWEDVFNHGRCVLKDGTISSIPRYYEKWFKENHPTEYLRYVTQTKTEKCEAAQERADAEMAAFWENVTSRRGGRLMPLTPNQKRSVIINQKFQMLQDRLKL